MAKYTLRADGTLLSPIAVPCVFLCDGAATHEAAELTRLLWWVCRGGSEKRAILNCRSSRDGTLPRARHGQHAAM